MHFEESAIHVDQKARPTICVVSLPFLIPILGPPEQI